jgi:membrane peptidoglycan carboxypeptidase
LSDNNARIEVFGPNSFLKIPGKTVAVKTGTSDDKRDNWAVGFTKSIVVGVWVGNNDNSPMNPKIASGITGASPIWHYLMKKILEKYPDGIIEKPEKVKALQIDAFLGGLPKEGFPVRSEYFIEGTEPKEISPFYKRIGDKDYVLIKETDPVSTDGRNRWQEGIDEWVRAQSDEKYHPKEITPTNTPEPTKQETQLTITPSPSITPSETPSPTSPSPTPNT